MSPSVALLNALLVTLTLTKLSGNGTQGRKKVSLGRMPFNKNKGDLVLWET